MNERKRIITREMITYLISGGVTTLVNYLIYAALLMMDLPYLWANGISWCGAVLAAYVMNRRWVFHSGNSVGREMFSFIGLRFLTLLSESALLWLMVEKLRVPAFGAKIVVSIVTVLANYLLCKFKIFGKESQNHGQNQFHRTLFQ